VTTLTPDDHAILEAWRKMETSMPIIPCYVDDLTMKRLQAASQVLGRPVDELAECAISEAAIQAVPCINGRPIDGKYEIIWDTIGERA
jgi:hypothetical protein